MRVAVSGASGLVGSALLEELKQWGHETRRLVRSEAQLNDDTILWDPTNHCCEAEKLQECDAVVHLAGENVANGRWNDQKKERIKNSRVEGTRFLSEVLTSLSQPPKVLICASAIGYYGDRGETLLTEDATPGRGFLSAVCQEWEDATAPAANAGIRVVNLRIGVVLSDKGGALKRMLLPFQLGLGGVIGSGEQYISWIAHEDLIKAIHFALTHDNLYGPVNAVAPSPVTNYVFTKALGNALHRPTIFPMPAFAVRLAFGEMADELLLSSTRVVPQKLEQSGFEFQYSDINSALIAIMFR